MGEDRRVEEYVQILKEQDSVLLKIINDTRIPNYIRQVYADMYNELHIKITEDEVID